MLLTPGHQAEHRGGPRSSGGPPPWSRPTTSWTSPPWQPWGSGRVG